MLPFANSPVTREADEEQHGRDDDGALHADAPLHLGAYHGADAERYHHDVECEADSPLLQFERGAHGRCEHGERVDEP